MKGKQSWHANLIAFTNASAMRIPTDTSKHFPAWGNIQANHNHYTQTSTGSRMTSTTRTWPTYEVCMCSWRMIFYYTMHTAKTSPTLKRLAVVVFTKVLPVKWPLEAGFTGALSWHIWSQDHPARPFRLWYSQPCSHPCSQKEFLVTNLHHIKTGGIAILRAKRKPHLIVPPAQGNVAPYQRNRVCVTKPSLFKYHLV